MNFCDPSCTYSHKESGLSKAKVVLHLERDDQQITVTIEGSEELVQRYADKMVSEIERS